MSDTPPPFTYDLKAAYDWRTAMLGRADGTLNDRPAWHGWALVEAFVAGVRYAEARKAAESKEWKGLD